MWLAIFFITAVSTALATPPAAGSEDYDLQAAVDRWVGKAPGQRIDRVMAVGELEVLGEVQGATIMLAATDADGLVGVKATGDPSYELLVLEVPADQGDDFGWVARGQVVHESSHRAERPMVLWAGQLDDDQVPDLILGVPDPESPPGTLIPEVFLSSLAGPYDLMGSVQATEQTIRARDAELLSLAR